jgi:nodulation protein E
MESKSFWPSRRQTQVPRRVAITGLGAICALGHNIQEIWSGLRAGRCGFGPDVGPITAVDASQLRACYAAEVRGFDPARQIEGSKLALMDRFCQFAFVAAREALANSGLAIARARPAPSDRAAISQHDTNPDAIGIVIGAGGGAMITAEQVAGQAHNGRVHPFSVPRYMASSAPSHISMEFSITGPSFAVSSACSSANHAIGQAFWMVRSGQLNAAVTGGAEAPFCLSALKAWDQMRVLSPDLCRPFSAGRRGMILGEGAAILVLEEMELARARGATIYGEIAGCGFSSDAGHITQPSLDGPVRAMQAALRDAAIEPECIGHINAHGTGTQLNDSLESRAIRAVFGERSASIPVTSTKSMHGHALGASGAIEAIATVLAVREGILPPTINFIAPDPECALDVVANDPRPAGADFALSNSFAFGGLNAVLAFRRP